MLQESVVRMFFGESHMWRVVLMCAQKIIFVNFARSGLNMWCYRPWYKNKRGRGAAAAILIYYKLIAG